MKNEPGGGSEAIRRQGSFRVLIICSSWGPTNGRQRKAAGICLGRLSLLLVNPAERPGAGKGARVSAAERTRDGEDRSARARTVLQDGEEGKGGRGPQGVSPGVSPWRGSGQRPARRFCARHPEELLAQHRFQHGYEPSLTDLGRGQLPFQIRGFHSDHGSEFVNHTVARLLDKLRVEFQYSCLHSTRVIHSTPRCHEPLQTPSHRWPPETPGSASRLRRSPFSTLMFNSQRAAAAPVQAHSALDQTVA